MIFSKKELSEIFDRAVVRDADGVCVNSKNIKEGDLFVALKGERTDGHNFIGEALDGGAALAIVEKDAAVADPDRIIKVDSSREALVKLAKYNISRSDAKYVGVTGSVGKTTVKDLIFHILNQQPEMRNAVYASRKNQNSQIGLPVCAASMPRNSKFGIFEMGMSNFGDIRKLTGIVSPTISVVSRICEAHLEFFDSVTDIAAAKSEIFETEKPQEAAILPKDSAYAEFLEKRARKNGIKNVFTFGSANADARLIECGRVGDRLEIAAEIFGEKIACAIENGNDALVLNSLAGILCACVIAGISPQKSAAAVCSFEPPSGRGIPFHLKNRDIILIDDSYNACPTSVRSAILSLARYEGRRKILVLGDMLELGRDAVRYHENLSATAGKIGVDKVFTCGPLAGSLFDNLEDCRKGARCENSWESAEEVLKEIREGDCILVKGSNSVKMNVVVEAVKKFEG
ncbi:MAG: UDP-N-acetylmuramoyl-tripeptide--D-alanyl-D-alanine ligase [Holosporaceae bacterium]|jgi:UDP-N-acetylmuramoyl-tripeptide--D-alanyl-D-alanine ligase|nr:UDP-N-acetylmuramoyl-tripeptide--D-alanyl-D-alanine ligase [Holosporaceae bacterium]